MSWSLRPAAAGDAERIAAVVAEAFEGYRAFAPSGWSPPPPHSELALIRAGLANADVWWLVAEADRALLGHVAIRPAATSAVRSSEPELAHLWQLFIRSPWHGSGLATELHAAAVREAEQRRFSSMRVFTPAGQARARRFYEREGWAAKGPAFVLPDFGLPVVEYRRAINSSV
ncbi:MAG: Acetyltransferase domain [Thermoleophilaceae bacterium]|jgi:GNAT superfamily N-acetyltransferase|nr:Acetyltransferase domain [Thermoleophilaceae bacterium]